MPAAGASSTAARTGPIASTQGARVQNAEPACRSGPAVPSAAATAADRSRAVLPAAAGWKREWAGSAASWAARTFRIATTRAICGNRVPSRKDRRVRRELGSASGVDLAVNGRFAGRQRGTFARVDGNVQLAVGVPVAGGLAQSAGIPRSPAFQAAALKRWKRTARRSRSGRSPTRVGKFSAPP